jgi:hypothetical protein
VINIIPEAIKHLVDNYDPEDYFFKITEILRKESNAICKVEAIITCDDEDLKDSHRYWTININGFKECKLTLAGDSNVEILTDHPLLWKYNDVQASLYFNGTCSDPYKLVLDLYQLNEQLFDGHHNFINIKGYHHLLQQPGGFLASGPQKLLERYAQLLEIHALTTSIISKNIPTEWDGDKHVPVSRQTKMCWIGNDFIIGESIEFVA